MNENINQLRDLISSAITILELLEDSTTDGRQNIAILDTIELLRNERMKIDATQLKNNSYEIATKEMHDIASKLKILQKKLKKELAEIETRLHYIGRVARLIKILY